MEQLALAAFYLGMIAYSAATTLYFVDLARRERQALLARWAGRLFGSGVLLHATHIVTTSFVLNMCPVASLPFALSFTAVLMGAVYFGVRSGSNIDALGVVVAPIALSFLIGAHVLSTGQSGPPPSVLLILHIAANFLGFGLFLMAGAAGAFYLVQERRLKARRGSLSLGGKLPALDVLDTTEHRLLLAGFPLLTLGAVTGAVFLLQQSELSFSRILVVILAYGTWVQVAAMLLLRAIWGWRGRRIAYGTLVGVACVAIVVAIYLARSFGGLAS
jgi:ABC-type uncharacterized transport system permease subunit